jgi:glycosyltransferase involved in cell wall biosynthesis
MIERCRASTLDKNVFLFKLVNVLTTSLSIFCMGMSRITKGDIVLVVTNPPLLPFFIAVVCRLRGAYGVLRIDDVYPDVLINAGVINSKGILARALNTLTKRLYLGVDRIVVLGRDMARLVCRKLGEKQRPVVIIPNWAELDLVVPQSRSQNALLQELGLSHKFVVEYAGNIGPLQDVETLLTSVTQLREREDIHFLFIGSGSRERALTAKAAEAGLTNLTFLGAKPRRDQPNFLNACDVILVSLVPGMTGVSVPSRMYNFMAAGKPVIAIVDDNSEIAKVVQEEQIGWVVPPGQPDKIVEAILEAQTDAGRLAEMGARARTVAETKYSFEHVISAYGSLIDGLGDAAR